MQNLPLCLNRDLQSLKYLNNWAPIILTASGYSQDWLRGDEVSDRDQAHPHEGLRLADKSGWIAVGQTISENPARVYISQL